MFSLSFYIFFIILVSNRLFLKIYYFENTLVFPFYIVSDHQKNQILIIDRYILKCIALTLHHISCSFFVTPLQLDKLLLGIKFRKTQMCYLNCLMFFLNSIYLTSFKSPKLRTPIFRNTNIIFYFMLFSFYLLY